MSVLHNLFNLFQLLRLVTGFWLLFWFFPYQRRYIAHATVRFHSSKRNSISFDQLNKKYFISIKQSFLYLCVCMCVSIRVHRCVCEMGMEGGGTFSKCGEWSYWKNSNVILNWNTLVRSKGEKAQLSEFGATFMKEIGSLPNYTKYQTVPSFGLVK